MTLAACPVCLGDGSHDFRDSDAMIGETFTDEEIRLAVARGMGYPLGVIACEECDGTGLVGEDRAKDIRAGATAWVDQQLARLRDRLEAS